MLRYATTPGLYTCRHSVTDMTPHCNVVLVASQVIAEARRLGFYSVRGNHDDKALASYESFLANKPVPAKQKWVKEMPPGAAEWLHKLPFTIRLPSYGLVVVHAGLVPDVSLWPNLKHEQNMRLTPDGSNAPSITDDYPAARLGVVLWPVCDLITPLALLVYVRGPLCQ